MDQDKIEILLFSYFSGQLIESEELELLEWLNADEKNKKLLSQMAEWWAMAHVPLFMSDMKSDFKEHFSSLLAPSVSIQKKRINWIPFIRIAASILILVSVSVVSYYIGKTSQSENDSDLVYYETEVPLGSQSKVTLPDKSIVWVNAGSTLKYQDNTKESSRDVILKGEAYFEVAPDSLKPFIVKTEKLNIKVLGTSFNVKAYDDDETIDVALVSGKIDVSVDTEENDIELVPNQKLSFNKETNEVEVSIVYTLDYSAWKDGKLRFTEQAFPKIAKDLERVYNVQIVIESELLKKEIFSGSFTKNHTLADILKEIDVENKYTWTQNGYKYLICDK